MPSLPCELGAEPAAGLGGRADLLDLATVALALAGAAAGFGHVNRGDFLGRSSQHPRSGNVVVASKGDPSVGVFLKRGDAIAVWNGRDHVKMDDSVRLEIDGAGYDYVTVISPSLSSGYQVLHQGSLPRGRALLPVSWRIDQHNPVETMVVVLSRRPLRPTELEFAVRAEFNPDSWSTTLIFDKGLGQSHD